MWMTQDEQSVQYFFCSSLESYARYAGGGLSSRANRVTSCCGGGSGGGDCPLAVNTGMVCACCRVAAYRIWDRKIIDQVNILIRKFER